jgi:hypothetical protein
MFMAEAKGCCPALIVVPYEFEKYEEVSEQVSHLPTASGLIVCRIYSCPGLCIVAQLPPCSWLKQRAAALP